MCLVYDLLNCIAGNEATKQRGTRFRPYFTYLSDLKAPTGAGNDNLGRIELIPTFYSKKHGGLYLALAPPIQQVTPAEPDPKEGVIIVLAIFMT